MTRLSPGADYGDELTNIQKLCGSTAMQVYHELLVNSRERKPGKKSSDRWSQELQKKIAIKINRTIRTVQAAIRRLKANGFLVIKRFFACIGNQSNFYKFPSSVLDRQPMVAGDDALKAAESYRTKQNSSCLISNIPIGNIYTSPTEEERTPVPPYTFHRMSAWNQRFPNHQVSMKYAKSLHKRYGEFLADAIACAAWMDQIAATPALFAPGFVLRMDSACSPGFREKLANGFFARGRWQRAYGWVKAQVAAFAGHTYTGDQICAAIDDLHEEQEVKQVRYGICKAVGNAEYHSWWHGAKYAIKHGKVYVQAATEFIANKWEERHNSVIFMRMDDLTMVLQLPTDSVDNIVDNHGITSAVQACA